LAIEKNILQLGRSNWNGFIWISLVRTMQ